MSLIYIFCIIYLKFRKKITKNITIKSNSLNSLALLLEISEKTFNALLSLSITQ